jgi:hypothetical protein
METGKSPKYTPSRRTSDAMSSRSFRKLSFQQLENRMLMAGNVAVSVQNHALVVTGDNNDNAIEIEQVGNGQYEILGTNTTINGKLTPQTFSGVTGDFNINLGGGYDILSIVAHQGSPVITLPGNLKVMCSGSGNIVVDRVSILGGVSISAGSLSHVSFSDSGIGSPSFNFGENDCSINLGDSSYVYFDYTPVQRDFTVNMNISGNGSDSVVFDGAPVGRNLTIQTGNGIDQVEVNEASVGKKLTIQTGGGNDMVTLGEWANYDGYGNFVSVNSQYGMSADQIYVDLGTGDDRLRLCNVAANQATYLGGDGVDAVFNDGGTGLFGSFSGFETMPHKPLSGIAPIGPARPWSFR